VKGEGRDSFLYIFILEVKGAMFWSGEKTISGKLGEGREGEREDTNKLVAQLPRNQHNHLLLAGLLQEIVSMGSHEKRNVFKEC
jgi:hypothetical protein